MNWSIFGRFELYRIVRCWTVNRYIIHSLMLHLIFCMDKLTLRSSLVCVCVCSILVPAMIQVMILLEHLKSNGNFAKSTVGAPLGPEVLWELVISGIFWPRFFPWFEKKRVSELSEIGEKGLGKWSLASYCGCLYSHYYKKGVSIDIFSNKSKHKILFSCLQMPFFFQTWDHATLHHWPCQFLWLPSVSGSRHPKLKDLCQLYRPKVWIRFPQWHKQDGQWLDSEVLKPVPSMEGGNISHQTGTLENHPLKSAGR